MAITAGGDINLLSSFALAPYQYGNLSLTAVGNILGQLTNGQRTTIYMSEIEPDQVYGSQQWNSSYVISGGPIMGDKGYDDPEGILHTGDVTPAVVNAGGNISDLAFYMPKEAEFTAGGNISDIFYSGHNNNSTDITIIKAVGNIEFSSLNYVDQAETGIQVGGPGTLIIEAGDSIDLGTTAGIQVLGNTLDTIPGQLPATGCMLIVAAGYNGNLTDTASDVQFFQALQTMGTVYSEDLAAGNTSAANAEVAEARSLIISPLEKTATGIPGSGNINMTTSQISSLSGQAVNYTFDSSSDRDSYFAANPALQTAGLYILIGSQLEQWNGSVWANINQGIFILASGTLNVGRSTFVSAAQTQSTGIFTAQGGDIDIFANGDVNVNESRIMTFMGGDITVWSDTGSINAGRGSKTAVTASPPAQEFVERLSCGRVSATVGGKRRPRGYI